MLLGIIIALGLMYLGEKLQNQTKEIYVGKGYDWSKVILYSNAFGLICGLMSFIIITKIGINNELNPALLTFATTITSYITAQSIMTDIKVLVINRNILRVAYLSMYILSLYNVFTYKSFFENKSALILFTITLIILFIVSSIGPSDIRAIAVALPFVISIGGYLAIYTFVATLLVISIVMGIHRNNLANAQLKSFKIKYSDMYEEVGERRFKSISKKTLKDEFDNSEEHEVPVGPFMILPFLVFLIIYPFLV